MTARPSSLLGLDPKIPVHLSSVKSVYRFYTIVCRTALLLQLFVCLLKPAARVCDLKKRNRVVDKGETEKVPGGKVSKTSKTSN